MASFSFKTNSFLSICILKLVLTTTVVSGLKLQLFRKNHRAVKHLWTPSLLDKPFKAEITFEIKFFVHFSVGTPPFKTLAVFDTGSAIFWLQTSTCKRCVAEGEGILTDLGQSSTMELVPYHDDDCAHWSRVGATFPRISPSGSLDCYYRVGYVDGTRSMGYVATFEATYPGDELEVRLLMGVGLENYGFINPHTKSEYLAPGVFGLSPSAWYQFQKKFQVSKFSFCIPSNLNTTGYLLFGEAAEFRGPSFQYNAEYVDAYGLKLTDISLNGEPVEPQDHDRDSWDGFQMNLDTGTPISRVHPKILDALRYEFMSLFGHFFSAGEYSLCWREIDMDTEVIKKMTITLHFDEV